MKITVRGFLYLIDTETVYTIIYKSFIILNKLKSMIENYTGTYKFYLKLSLK